MAWLISLLDLSKKGEKRGQIQIESFICASPSRYTFTAGTKNLKISSCCKLEWCFPRLGNKDQIKKEMRTNKKQTT